MGSEADRFRVVALFRLCDKASVTQVHPVAARTPAYFDTLFPEPALAPAKSVHLTSGDVGPDIIEQIRAFSFNGVKTLEQSIDDIPYLVNEYWTSGQRQAHSLQEISYRACFKPQLPDFFIERLTKPGGAVHDPFMGRGTTPIQAALTGRRAFGNDINPLSTLLTRPRLAPPNIAAIIGALEAVPWSREPAVRDDLLVFYHPETLRRLTVLREWLMDQAPLDEHTPDAALDWIRMVAINRLTGHSPGFFSVYTMPPNQAVGIEAQRKINVKRAQSPEARDVVAIILKKTRSLLADGVPPSSLGSGLLTGSAAATKSIGNAEIDLVVTSPPFLDIVQYADDNWLRCWFAGIDTGSVEIAMHRTEQAWTDMVRDVLIEQARIVRPGGHVAFEVGEVRKGRVLLEQLVWRAAEGLPFERLAVMVNQQAFTKTANCWGVSNNSGGTNTNRIVLLRRR